MFENIIKFFKNLGKKERNKESSDTAKERLHLVLMQDRANVSADFLELMKQEIIEVIKKYIDVDEKAIDVRLTNKANEDGTVGAPALYANIPIMTIKNEARKLNVPQESSEVKADNEEKTEKEKKSGKSEEKQDDKKSTQVETENKEETEKSDKKQEEIEENSDNKEDKKEEVNNSEETSKESETKDESKEEIEKEKQDQKETKEDTQENAETEKSKTNGIENQKEEQNESEEA